MILDKQKLRVQKIYFYIYLSLAIYAQTAQNYSSVYNLQTCHYFFFHEAKNMDNRSSQCKSLLYPPKVRMPKMVDENLPNSFSFLAVSGMWVLALACYCPRNSALFLICLSPGLLGVLLLNLTILNLYQIVFLKDVFVDYKHVYHLVSLHLAMRDFTQP